MYGHIIPKPGITILNDLLILQNHDVEKQQLIGAQAAIY